MLKRDEVVRVSNAAMKRVASGAAGTTPVSKKHLARFAKLKAAKKRREAPQHRHKAS
jgi:hypothetical protein